LPVYNYLRILNFQKLLTKMKQKLKEVNAVVWYKCKKVKVENTVVYIHLNGDMQ